MNIIVSHHELEKQIGSALTENRLKLQAAQELLNTLQDKVMSSVMSMVHLTSGLPGRGTETAALTTSNTHRAQRDVFIENNYTILINPNKAKNEKNKSICRYIFNENAKIFEMYLIFFRPLMM